MGSPPNESSLIKDLADSITSIVRATYEVETVHWGDRLLRTVVTGPEYRHQTGPLIGLLPVPRRLLSISRRRLTYGCQGTLRP